VRPSLWDLATNEVVPVGGVLEDPRMRNQSASVLLPPAQEQRVMLIGGGSEDMHMVTGATNRTAITDLSGAVPQVRTAAPMEMARMHLCATQLPDRTVLVNGGAMMEETPTDDDLRAELYDPVANTWRMAAAARVPRLYHSVALLMPDGKVITSGSNPDRGVEDPRIEVFWPPYLFAGDRPSCTPAATEVTYGSTLQATVPGAADPGPGGLGTACLIRAGATTHSSNAEQRLVDLPFQLTGAAAVTLTLPSDPHLAPPGWYLLFVVTRSGVPSQARWAHLT
jgi:hypothetical protein